MRHACSGGDDDGSEGELNNPTVPDSENGSVGTVDDEDDPFAKFEKEVSIYFFSENSKFRKPTTKLMHVAENYSFLCLLLKPTDILTQNYNFLKASIVESVSPPVTCHKGWQVDPFHENSSLLQNVKIVVHSCNEHQNLFCLACTGLFLWYCFLALCNIIKQ
jgi:hypothetical protein